MQAERHSMWSYTPPHPHTKKTEDSSVSTSCSQNLLVNPSVVDQDVPLPANTSYKTTSCPRCCFWFSSEASLSRNHKSRSSKARAAIRHNQKSNVFLVCRWNLSHIYQMWTIYLFFFPLPPFPSGYGTYQRWLAHQHNYHTYQRRATQLKQTDTHQP